MIHRKHTQRAIAALALATVALGAAGFAGSQHALASRTLATSQVLQYPNFDPSSSWPNTLDPANVTDSQSIMVINMIYGNLVKLDSKNAVVPDLATWTVSPNRKVYTFHLRDTKFSDGNPVTADDVIYSIERALNPKVNKGAPSPVASLYMGHILGAATYKGSGPLAGLKKIDSKTVQITLDSPISFFLQTLSYPTADILEKGKTPLNSLTTKNPLQNQISSGPWKISKFSYKNSLTFVPNPGYYNASKMKLTEIDMPFVGSQDTMYAGYQSGQYAMTSVPPKLLPQARTQPDFHGSPILAIDYITLDQAKLPFSNKNLRLAVSYAVDRTTINKDVLKGAQIDLYSVVPRGIPGYDADGYKYTPHYDLAKAKMYLAKAKAELGKNFPSSLTIKYQAGSASLDAEYTELQANWKAIGLNVKVQSLNFNSWLNLVTKPTTSVTYKGGDPWVENLWIDDYPDAQDFTTNLLTPSTNYNVGNYNDPQFNKWTDEALTAAGSERAQLYIKASRKALNDGAWIMIGQQTTDWRWKQNIKGMDVWSSTSNPYPLNNDWTNVSVQ